MHDRPLPPIPDAASPDAVTRCLREAGWPLRPTTPREPPQLPGLVAPHGALDLLPGSPTSLVWVGSLAEAPASSFVLRLARRSPGRSALAFGTARGRLAVYVCGLVDRGVRSWTAPNGPMRPVDTEVWRALLDAGAPSVAAMRLGSLLERRDVDARFFADVRRWRDAMTAAWSGVPDSAREPLSMLVLARLIFLAFVQRKGWLAGDPRYVARLLLDPQARDLYRGRLAPLFFDALNRRPDERASGAWFEGVPFLNGGLFEPSEVERACPEATLPDDVLRDGVDRVLEGYRFVEDERRVDGASIDPRMLGAVFEGLMSPDRRERTGTFYTPPGLVARVVDRALRAALAPKLAPAVVDALASGVSPPPAARCGAVDALRGLRVLDPAVGSGAFLLGALDWLSRAWRAVDDAPEAEIRRRVMSTSLFGIDLSPTAVLLCELRLWLSLASAMRDDEAPPPLPNLHHRIRVGNALLGASAYAAVGSAAASEARARLHACCASLASAFGVDKQRLDRERRLLEADLGRVVLSDEVARVRARLREAGAASASLFEEPGPEEQRGELSRRRLRRQLEELERERAAAGAASWAPGFDPQVHFGDVMGAGGFDAIVGNPPWVRLSSVLRSDRERIRARFRWMRSATQRSFGAQPDLSVAFVERALQLVRADGVVSLVVPNKLFTAQYGVALRRGLCRDHTLLHLDDLDARGEEPFGVDAYPAIVTVRRAPPAGASVVVRAASCFEARVEQLSFTHDPGGVWPLVEPSEIERHRRWSDAHPTLAQRFDVRMGIKTGCNRVFIDPPADVGPQVALLRGRDIGDTSVRPSARLLFAHDVEQGAPLARVDGPTQRYLEEHQQVLLNRADARPGTAAWQVFRAGEAAVGHRVVWRDIGQQLVAWYLPPVASGGPVVLNTVYFAVVPDETTGRRLARWLNTAPARWAARLAAEPALNGYRRFQASAVGSVPVPAAALEADVPVTDAIAVAWLDAPGEPRTLWEACR